MALEWAALAAVLVLAVVASLRCVWETDYWWQWKTGEIVARSGPPSVDPFSFAPGGREWIELRWLYCWALYQIVSVAGTAGAIVVKAAVLIAAFTIAAWGAARRAPVALTSAVAFVAVMASSQRFFLRPELATFLFLAIFIALARRHRERGGLGLLAMPLLQVAWVNTHTLFVLGPVVAALLVVAMAAEAAFANGADAAERARRLRIAGLAAALTTGACLVNPYGVRGALFPLRLFEQLRGTAFKTSIHEFMSPFAANADYTAVIYYMALAAVCIIAAIWSVRRIDLFGALVCAMMFYLSAIAIRNIPLFAIAALPFAIDHLRHAPRRFQHAMSRAATPARWCVSAAVCAAALVLAWQIATDRFAVRQHDTNQFGLGIAAHRYPKRAAEFLAAHPIGGNPFSTMHEASYLLARGFRVFIDPRLEVYGEEHFRRYEEMLFAGDAWRAAAQEFDIRAAIVDIGALDFIERLTKSEQWRLVYWDECAAIIARPDAAAGLASIATVDDHDAALARVRERLPRVTARDHAGVFARAVSPAPYHRVANFLTRVGAADRAEPFLLDALAANPRAARARVAYARLLEARGDSDGSHREYERAYRDAPSDAEVAAAAAIHAIDLAQPDEALRRLERALARHPDHALAWAVRGEAFLARREPANAEPCFTRAVQLDPRNALFAERLAAVRRSRVAPH
ncbi:MAG: tetratricopeptide repeat protein [bacterium]